MYYDMRKCIKNIKKKNSNDIMTRTKVKQPIIPIKYYLCDR